HHSFRLQRLDHSHLSPLARPTSSVLVGPGRCGGHAGARRPGAVTRARRGAPRNSHIVPLPPTPRGPRGAGGKNTAAPGRLEGSTGAVGGPHVCAGTPAPTCHRGPRAGGGEHNVFVHSREGKFVISRGPAALVIHPT